MRASVAERPHLPGALPGADVGDVRQAFNDAPLNAHHGDRSPQNMGCRPYLRPLPGHARALERNGSGRVPPLPRAAAERLDPAPG